jgi:hypothetical protein
VVLNLNHFLLLFLKRCNPCQYRNINNKDNSVIKEKKYIELIERSRENKENIKVLIKYVFSFER